MRHLHLPRLQTVSHFNRKLTLLVGDCSYGSPRNRKVHIAKPFLGLLVFDYAANGDERLFRLILCPYRDYAASQQHHQDPSHGLFTECSHRLTLLSDSLGYIYIVRENTKSK